MSRKHILLREDDPGRIASLTAASNEAAHEATEQTRKDTLEASLIEPGKMKVSDARIAMREFALSEEPGSTKGEGKTMIRGGKGPSSGPQGYGPTACAASAVLLGLTVLVGWMWDVGPLKSILPGLVAMKANTAVGLLLAGASLWLMTARRTHWTLRWIGRGAAGLALLLGVLTLSQEVFGWDLGIDQLLFRDSKDAAFTAQPGRMAVLTALDFVLLGSALLLFDGRRAAHAVQGLAIVAGMLALLAVGRYLIGEPGFLVSTATPMALHTALGFLLLVISVMAATVDHGFLAWAWRHVSVVGTGVAVLMVLMVGLASFINTQRMHGAFRRVEHTQDVRRHLNIVESHVQDVGASVHGFLLTGQEEFLASVEATRQELTRELLDIQKLTEDNLDQEDRLAALCQSIVRRLAMADESVRLRREKGPDAVVVYLSSGVVERSVSDIRARLAEMSRVEEELLLGRRAAAETVTNSSWTTSVLLALLSLALLIAMIVRGRRLNATLDRRISERTHELARSNRALRMLCDCNQTLIRATDETELVQAICNLVVGEGGYRFCVVAYAEHDETQSLRVAARAGIGVDQLPCATTWADSDCGRGPASVAIRTGKPTVLHDIKDHPEVAEWQDIAGRLDLSSAAAIPLESSGGVLGTLVILSTEPTGFDESEMKILVELSKDVSFGIRTLRDRVAHRMANEALRRLKERYRHLFEAAQDGILFLDADTGKIVDVNPFLIELTGYSHDDFLSRHLWEIGPFKDIAASKASFSELQAKEHVRYEHLPLKTRDGRQIDVEFVSNAYHVDNQKVIQCNIRNITARKRGERDRQKLEEQLLASQKMEAIGSLAGGVAYDFNNLLSVILSYTGFALEGVRDGDPLRNDLLEVKIAGERAATLTRQLLAFSRKQVLQPVALSLNSIAAGVEKMLQRILGEDIDLVQMLAPDLGLTLADPGQIEQVLMNLVVNARDAMPEGGKLTIETSNVDINEEYAARHVAVEPGSYVQIAISDTGCGMNEQTRVRIFEPFFTTKENGKGTGLGLSTVYGIVKQSGGNIRVYSELGQGTMFNIYLPRELSVTTVTAIKPSTVPKRATGTETILVVEDEEALRNVAKRALDAAGYTTLTAANGDEAFLACAQHAGDIHLLLTDVVMPRMGGRVVAQELLKRRPTLKVIYMSGYTDDAIVRHGVLDAGTHFLGKPFIASDLTRKVREVLDEGIDSIADGRAQAIKPKDQPLGKDALLALPGDLLDKLRKAVTAARHDEIIEIAGDIRITDPDVATGLRRMADLFDYDGMRDLLGRGKGGQSASSGNLGAHVFQGFFDFFLRMSVSLSSLPHTRRILSLR